MPDHRALFDTAAENPPPFPVGAFAGRGIVIPGGGAKYLPCAWVCIKMLRSLGCTLPIELWHIGPRELRPGIRDILEPLGVTFVDALLTGHTGGGWPLKSHALLHTRFAEILLLDADNVPIADPAPLFHDPVYKEHGALFWPDLTRFAKDHPIWSLTGIPYRDEPEFESGQLLVDKTRCWQPLALAHHMNQHHAYWYRHILGDKDTFHLAWRRLARSYGMPKRPIERLRDTLCQHDPAGRRIFQHRNGAKWQLHGENPRIPGFRHEDQCLAHLAELESQWAWLPPGVRRWKTSNIKHQTPNIQIAAPEPASQSPEGAHLKFEVERLKFDVEINLPEAARALCARPWLYRRLGHDQRLLTFLENGAIGEGRACCERWWNLRLLPGSPDEFGNQEAMKGRPQFPGFLASKFLLEIFSLTEKTLTATLGPDGIWRGHWLRFEKMPVEFLPA